MALDFSGTDPDTTSGGSPITAQRVPWPAETLHVLDDHVAQPGRGRCSAACRGGPATPPGSGGGHHSDDKEVGMDIDGGHGGGGSGGDGGDGHPGTPWTPPSDPPSPDGTTPPGDGGHRK